MMLAASRGLQKCVEHSWLRSSAYIFQEIYAKEDILGKRVCKLF